VLNNLYFVIAAVVRVLQRETEEKYEYIKRVIRIRKSKDRLYNGQKKNDKTSHRKLKTEQHEPRYLQIMDELGCYGRVYSSCSTCDRRGDTLVINPVIYHES
jgi:prophage antirepressor-like protein